MTVAEKIKYLRKQIGITQDHLGKKSNIHPVSIRKYETNKMKPLPDQIEKLAKALDVSPFALNETYNSFKIQTLGDLYSIIVFLYNTKLIKFNKVNNNINIEANSCIVQFIDINISINETLKENETYPLFLAYIEMCCNLDSFINSLSDLNNPVAIRTITELKKGIEKIELDLQQSTLLIK